MRHLQSHVGLSRKQHYRKTYIARLRHLIYYYDSPIAGDILYRTRDRLYYQHNFIN